MARTAKPPRTKENDLHEEICQQGNQTDTRSSPSGLEEVQACGHSKAGQKHNHREAPKVGVAELRVQVEKLERTNATLRTKGREAGRAAKTATAHIAELGSAVAV